MQPPRVWKLMIVELSGKKQRIALDEYSRLVVRFLILGQNLTPFWGSKVKFSRNQQFSTLCSYTSKTINRSDIKLSQACSPINSVQPYKSLLFLDGIFVSHIVPEVNSVTPIGKIAVGQTGSMSLIGIGWYKEAL